MQIKSSRYCSCSISSLLTLNFSLLLLLLFSGRSQIQRPCLLWNRQQCSLWNVRYSRRRRYSYNGNRYMWKHKFDWRWRYSWDNYFRSFRHLLLRLVVLQAQEGRPTNRRTKRSRHQRFTCCICIICDPSKQCTGYLRRCYCSDASFSFSSSHESSLSRSDLILLFCSRYCFAALEPRGVHG